MTGTAGPLPLVRRFAPADSAALADLVREVTLADLAPEFGAAHARAICAGLGPADLAARARRRLILVAERDARIVGTASLDAERVCGVLVDADHRRSGIGRRLLAALEVVARARATARLTLEARAAAVGFYERLGWRSRTRRPLGDSYVFVMGKPVGPTL
jgi:GNAT superfamily N-acetyltransferase